MKLSEILNIFNFSFERINGTFYVYDNEDGDFEEKANSVKGVIEIISGHIESQLEGAVEDIDMNNNTKTDTSKWEWKDFAEFFRQNNTDEEHHWWYFLIELCDALADMDNIEIS